MSSYLEALKKYAVFNGRARRKEYWYFVLFNLIFAFAASFLDGAIGTYDPETGYGLLGGLYTLAMILPSLAVGVRRLHDTGRSGWLILLSFVPFGGLVLLFFFLAEGQSGVNEYGPNPKSSYAGYTAAPIGAAGWYPDPIRRHQYRYWDSRVWTHHVSDGGVITADPLP